MLESNHAQRGQPETDHTTEETFKEKTVNTERHKQIHKDLTI